MKMSKEADYGNWVPAAALAMTLYMQRCRQLFDFGSGGVMGDIHQFLVDHFPWEESRARGCRGPGCLSERRRGKT